MTVISRYILVVFFCIPVSAAAADDWKYDDNYRAVLLYLHELVDYEYSATWNDRWERGLLKGNSLRLSFGSITTADLFNNIRLRINQEVGKGFRFHGDFNRYASHHMDLEQEANWMGFEKHVLGRIHFLVLFNPAISKEEIDARAGVLMVDAERSRYLSLTLRFDDFLYTEKNDRGGESIQEPIGLQWLTRYALGRWVLFSEGTCLRGFKRRFPDRERSPEFFYHQQQTNNFTIKLRYRTTDQAFFETSVYHYRFDDRQSGYAPDYRYSYKNEIVHGTLKYIFPLTAKSRIRLALHHVFQKARAHGFQDYAYERTEFLPAVVGEYFLSPRFTAEFGYLGTVYDWDYDHPSDREDYRASSYADKLKLGFLYRFNENSRIQFSLSHEPSPSKFGGGNVQYLMFF
ncbi:MAG: hypothetical protein JSU69_00485 [Candidatus Zixiibacteriota bacterium]|nr:MAG: hypothetical protein JSU69_00485 [candidate division Zixibacteria bacterium]